MNATITERGNGFPDVGDYVAGDDGEVYRVVRWTHDGRIFTGRPGAGNSICAEVELADWDDIDDAEGDMTCSAEILTDATEAVS